MTDILIKLKDDNNYYGEYGKQFLSNSDIDTLINNPADLHKPSEDKVEFVFGQAFHELVMFGETDHTEVVISAGNRNANIYKEAVKENGGKILLLEKEYDQLMFVVEKALANSVVNDYVLGQNVEYEVPMVGCLFPKVDEEDQEVLWKGKADIVRDDCIVDLKTTSSLKSFSRSVKSYNYDSQAYIYSTLLGKPMIFLAIDKNTGVAGVFDVSPFTLSEGYDKALHAQKNYIEYFVNKSVKTENHTIYGTV